MRQLANHARVGRLIEDAVTRFELDLTGVTVLTETASGPFVVTPLIAARAGADVIAVTRDSRFGSAVDVKTYTSCWARRLGIASGIEVFIGDAIDRAGDADLITNLGFVRPIDSLFIGRMREHAAVTLMCEPWEIRAEDVDVPACVAAGIPVLGTNERDARLETFRFVGMLALKLLLELEIEVLRCRILVLSSEPFAGPVAACLRAAGAELTLVDLTRGDDPCAPEVQAALESVDAVLVAEHRDRRAVVGGASGLPLEALVARGTPVAHLAGRVDDPDQRLRKHPPGPVAPATMTVTTDALGPLPVVDLHAAGLRVGQALVTAMRATRSAADAQAAALGEGLALPAGSSS
jgi:hypothetical protein